MNNEHALPPGRWVKRGLVMRFEPLPAAPDVTTLPKVIAPPQPCGTLAAYRRHLKAGEPVCDDCQTASRDDARERRRKHRRESAQRQWAPRVVDIDLAAATVAHLVTAVATAAWVDATHIYGRHQHPAAVDARHMVMYLARHEGLSWPAIGKALRRHHTTVMNGAHRVESDGRLRATALAARQQINERRAA